MQIPKLKFMAIEKRKIHKEVGFSFIKAKTLVPLNNANPFQLSFIVVIT